MDGKWFSRGSKGAPAAVAALAVGAAAVLMHADYDGLAGGSADLATQAVATCRAQQVAQSNARQPGADAMPDRTQWPAWMARSQAEFEYCLRLQMAASGASRTASVN
jgi:hypothetical protein